jgi:DNA-binding transcriptional MerR regulator
MANLTRSELAKKLKVHPETLRYYEAQKLLKTSARIFIIYDFNAA